MNINKYHQPLFPMSCSLLTATAIAGMRTPGLTITPSFGAIRSQKFVAIMDKSTKNQYCERGAFPLNTAYFFTD